MLHRFSRQFASIYIPITSCTYGYRFKNFVNKFLNTEKNYFKIFYKNAGRKKSGSNSPKNLKKCVFLEWLGLLFLEVVISNQNPMYELNFVF